MGFIIKCLKADARFTVFWFAKTELNAATVRSIDLTNIMVYIEVRTLCRMLECPSIITENLPFFFASHHRIYIYIYIYWLRATLYCDAGVPLFPLHTHILLVASSFYSGGPQKVSSKTSWCRWLVSSLPHRFTVFNWQSSSVENAPLFTFVAAFLHRS